MECLIATIECVQSTTERWKTHVYRCERLVEGSSSQIHFPSVTSEKNFEDSFGFIKKKGTIKLKRSIIVAKRRHVIDFQMRMCKICHFVNIRRSLCRIKGISKLKENIAPSLGLNSRISSM